MSTQSVYTLFEGISFESEIRFTIAAVCRSLFKASSDVEIAGNGQPYGGLRASGAASVSDAYGSGYQIATLKEAIDRISYPGLDLSHLSS